MTTATFSVAPDNSTDANFRAWGSGLSAAMATVGLVKASDTGQIDWTTVVKPPSINTYQGYEIWRFSDSLQATYPLYLKMEFGSSASNFCSLKLTVGKGSDGAGTITSPFGTLLTLSIGNGSTTPYNSYVFSDTSSLTFCLFPLMPTNPQSATFSLERSRDPTGAATGYGFTRSSSAVAVAGAINTYNYANGVISPTNLTTWPVILPGAAAGGFISGGRAIVGPAMAYDGYGHFWQTRNLLTYTQVDATQVVPVTVTGFGTYLPLGNCTGTWGGSGQYVMMAWY